MLQKTFESIEKTKRCFEESFKSGTYYDKQTQDETHLMLILNAIKVTGSMNILDLGTGTGYLAFPLARKYPDAQVTGLDIVEEALDKNRECAESEGLKKLGFVNTFSEISRVLKPGGIISIHTTAKVVTPKTTKSSTTYLCNFLKFQSYFIIQSQLAPYTIPISTHPISKTRCESPRVFLFTSYSH